MGISFVIENSKPLLPSVSVLYKVIPAYIAINFTLNVILTLMIVGRLALRSKQIRDIMGPWSGAGDWYKRIAVMFVESCALYAISLLVYLIAYTRNTPLVDIFYQVFIETQVRIVSRFPHAGILGYCCLIVETNRSLLRSSSFYGSPSGPR